MKIVVFGAEGQLGSTLRDISMDYPHCRFFFASQQLCDITNRESIERVLDESKGEVVINCAAYTAVDRAESEPELTNSVNSRGVELLARVVKERDGALIHISTDYVFGGDRGRTPIVEDDKPNPAGVYGCTKLEGERAIERVGCRAVVVRTSWLYSSFGDNFVKTMLRLGRERGVVSVVDDQWGYPTYAENLARAIMTIAERGVKGFEVVHYCDGDINIKSEEGITWCGFAKEIFRQANICVEVTPITTIDYPTAAKRPMYSVLSTAKAEAWGLKLFDWRESLGRCLVKLGERGVRQ